MLWDGFSYEKIFVFQKNGINDAHIGRNCHSAFDLKLLGFLNPNEDKFDFETIKLIIANFSVAGIFVFVLIYPHKFGIIAIACFYYAIAGIMDKTINPMGILMFGRLSSF